MKTKFYKRLVPLALIASMAVTNVGITSASANTPVAIEQTTGMDAPVVGVSIPAEANVVFASEDATNGTVEITINEPNETWSGNDKFKLYLSDDDQTGIVSNSYSDSKIIFEVPKSAFENGDSIGTASVVYTGGRGEVQVGTGNITLKKTIQTTPSTDPTTPTVAAGDAFQIPGGLASKGTTVNAYTVGVAKVVGTAPANSNEVQNTSIIVSGPTKNVLGEWAAQPDANKYVLYYVPNGSEAKTFVRVLTDEEATKIPYGTFKTLEGLTTYTATATGTAKTDTDQYKIENNEVFSHGVGTAVNFNAVIDAAWAGTLSAVAPDPATGEVTDANKALGVVKVPGITAFTSTTALKEDTKLTDLLKAKWDEKNTGYKFDEQYEGVDPSTKLKTAETYYVTKGGTEEAPTFTLTDDGKGALLALFKELTADEKLAILSSEDLGEATKKFYDELYAYHAAKYVNAYNATVVAAGKDVTKLQWTLETLKTGSEKNAKNRDVYTAANKNAKFWGKSITKKYNSKTKAYTTNKGTADAAVARVEGATATITNTAANKSFNNTVYLKAVTDAYVNPSKTVTAASQDANVVLVQPFYITPALPSEFNSNVKLPTGLTSLSGDNAGDAKAVYTLTLKTGKSVKLPFKLKDGQEKDLVYDVSTGSTGFTVINGKVTGTADNNATLATTAEALNTAYGSGNTPGYIKVYSRANPSVYVLVQVKVEEEIKSIRANTTSLAIYPGSSQIVSLGTNPATSIGDGYDRFEITKPDGVDVKYIDSNGEAQPLDSDKYALSNRIQVNAKSDATVNKGDKIVVKLAKGTTAVSTKSTKEFAITLSPATAPQDIKSVKSAVKSKITEASKIDVNGDTVADENDIVKVINVPKGGSVNLGYAIAPVAANATISSMVVDENNESSNVASVSGDVLKGENVGEAYVKLLPGDGDHLSDTFKVTGDANKNGQVVYKVNVYDPGEAIRFTDESYVVKGGFLMTKANADTSCDKNFTAGDAITMTPPSVDTTEKINWTANNPAAIKFETVLMKDGNVVAAGTEDAVEKLKITPYQTGTFTVTGMTEFTKQKMTFKINVVAANEGTATGSLTFTKADGSAFTTGDEQTAFKVGDKLNAFMAAGSDIGGKVVFTSSDKTVAAVTAKGLVTAKKAGKAKITAKMTYGTKSVTSEVELTVAPADIIVKSTKCAVGAVKSTPFAVSASLKNFNKSTMKLNWFAVTKGAGTGDGVARTALGDGLTDAKLSGKAQIGTVGSYDVYVEVKSGAETLSTIKVGSVDIYGTAVNGANVNNGDKDSKAAIANLAKAPKEGVESTAKYGTGHGYVYVPVFLTEKDGKTSKKYTGAVAAQNASDIIAGDGDIVWTSSNKSLARVVDFQVNGAGNYVNQEENDIIKNYKDAAGVAKIHIANTNYTGMVTIKGTTKNSNKSFTIKLNVKDLEARNAATALQTPYNPQDIASIGSSVTLAAIDDSAITAKKPLANGTDGDAKIKEKAATVREGKTFTMTKWVLVKGNVIKTINADTEHLVFEPNSADINTETGVCKFTDGLAANPTASTTNYLTAKSAKSVTAAPTADTWYLATADVTYKVVKAHKDAVTADAANNVAGQSEVFLSLEETAIKVTKIASKTPITKIAATTTGGDTSGDGDNTDGNNG